MTFWQKFKRLVFQRDFMFVVVLFVLAIVIGVFTSVTKVKVNFGEEAVDIYTNRYVMNVPYGIVESIELVEMPELGEVVNGREDGICNTGVWSNEAWGEYTACLHLQTNTCIVIHLNDGRIFAFSHRSDAVTAEDFAAFQSRLTNE